ncbi:MAG: chemotaxis protein CheW [Proteobacteria bacterium]|nr:chemotaxis protein CheW [Pseudomonadota bacterium]
MNADTRDDLHQYLSFTLGGQTFGIAIGLVREINQVPEITPVPNAPHCVVGVINLRAKVIPVVDLRLKFKLQPRPFNRDTCVIIVEAEQGLVAVVVDTVASVIVLKNDQIDAPSALVQGAANKLILGLARVGEGLVIILDIKKSLDQEQIHLLADFAQALSTIDTGSEPGKSA